MKRLAAAAFVLACSMMIGEAKAGSEIVLGDSIGVGVSMASGLPRLAKNSISIRGPKAIQQIKDAPANSMVFLSLGTNDAIGSLKGIDRGIDKIMAAADRQNLQLVWLGPPCVIKPWNSNVIKLDTILRKRLAGRATYVSLSRDDLCAPDLRGKDGVHFNMRGYAMLWAQAKDEAGL